MHQLVKWGASASLVLWAVTAAAQSDREVRAREELERQLQALVGTPPTKIKIEFVGLDQPIYVLKEAQFVLDGQKLSVGDLAALDAEGAHLVFSGDVKVGPHRLETNLQYQNKASVVVSSEGGYAWKLGSVVTFTNQAGLEVQVKVTPSLDPAATDVKQRMKLASPTSVRMLAQLDDGSMPAKPMVKAPDVPDAGVVADGAKGKTKAELAAETAEAKKKAREDALAAKQAAQQARQAQLAAAAEARRAAQDEARRKAAEAQADRQAALDAKRHPVQAAPAAPAPVEPPVVPDLVVDAGAPVEVDASAPAVGPVDVGTAPAVATAPTPTAPPAEEAFPWLWLVAGGCVVLAIIILMARRGPPSAG